MVVLVKDRLKNWLISLAEEETVIVAEENSPGVAIFPGGISVAHQAVIFRILEGSRCFLTPSSAPYLRKIMERCTPIVHPDLQRKIHRIIASFPPPALNLPLEIWEKVIFIGNLEERDAVHLKSTCRTMYAKLSAMISSPRMQDSFLRARTLRDVELIWELSCDGINPSLFGDIEVIESMFKAALFEPVYQPQKYIEFLFKKLLDEISCPYAQFRLAIVCGSIVTSSGEKDWRGDLMDLFPWHLVKLLDPSQYPNYIDEPILSEFSAESFINLTRRFPALEAVNLTGARKMDDATLIQLVERLPSLKRINVNDTAVTEDGQKEILTVRPDLEFCTTEAELLDVSAEEYEWSRQVCMDFHLSKQSLR